MTRATGLAFELALIEHMAAERAWRERKRLERVRIQASQEFLETDYFSAYYAELAPLANRLAESKEALRVARENARVAA